jgi:type I restriction enzyme R subunit
MREFNPRYAEAEGALLGQFRHLHTDIYGNRADRPQHASGCGGSLDLDGIPVRHP